MKKLSLFGFVVLTCTCAVPAFAEWGRNCASNGGTIITANKYGDDKGGLCNNPNDPNVSQNCNGKSFCLGPAMNWWSAFTWCESIGGKFASFSSICPGNQITPNGTCPNIKGRGSNIWGMTATGWGQMDALNVNLSNGKVDHLGDSNGGRNYQYAYAICEE